MLRNVRILPSMTTKRFLLSLTLFVFAAAQAMGVAVSGVEKKKICLLGTEESRLVNKWYADGTAAGNAGDYYDNRDRGHSSLGARNYPQIRVFEYTEAQKKGRLDWTAARRVLPHVTVGNSSTASGPTRGGSNSLRYYTTPMGMALLYLQYRGNNLYVYPEHRDHDPGHNGSGGYGDLFPTNSPYLVISQGSSGSDRVFMRAIVMTLAAFRPDVKKKLKETGLLMPTLQMIFRASNENLKGPEEYLTGKAHPTVFEGKYVDPVKMVKHAHSIRVDTIPPMVQMKVVEEDPAVIRKDHFDVGFSEVLCNTPAVIGRIHRRLARDRRIVVSAADSFDVNKKKLTYHWVVLRGNRERIRIRTRDGGAVAEIVVPHHSRQEISKGLRVESNRVDIGVFVHNGTSYSAPGFVTFYALDSEQRRYDEKGRLQEIFYSAYDTTLRTAVARTNRLIVRGYPVKDWQALFAALEEKADGLGARILKKRFSAVELAALRNVSVAFNKDYPEYADKRKGLEAEQEKAKKAHSEARKTRDECKKKLAEAEDAHKAGATDETAALVEKAKTELKEASDAERVARKEANRIRKEVDGVFDPLKPLLTAVDPAIKISPRALVERELGAVKNDVELFPRHAQEIHAMADGPTRLRAALERALSIGLFKELDENKFELCSMRPGDGPAAKRLTPFERHEVQRFNLALMRDVLFRDFLYWKEINNFVDRRLVPSKDWRDVYRYDAGGDLTGWSRYDGRTVQEFTAQGHLVVEKDKEGRPVKTRRVEYILEIGYTDAKNEGKLAGRVLFDGQSCSVYDGGGKLIVDRNEKGREVKPFQVQFMVMNDKPADSYTIDINHFDAQRKQTGWTRYDGDTVMEFVRKGDKFVGKGKEGREIANVDPKYQVPSGPAKVLVIPVDF